VVAGDRGVSATIAPGAGHLMMNEFACSLASALAFSFGGQAPVPGHPMETVMQDDAELLYHEPAKVRSNVRKMAELGVDRVRLTASWSGLAPDSEQRRHPRFDATNSLTYPHGGFERLDRAVREVREAGLKTMIDVAFFAPSWSVDPRYARDPHPAWRPSPREFGLFTRAVAERYGGSFQDPEGDPGEHLPAVRLWTTWNEPNHSTFLRPQWERAGGRRRPASPHHYRRMHNAAYDQLKAVSADNSVLIGGLAAFGERGRGAKSNIGPLRFTRELACVDDRLRPLRRRACRDFAPLRADGFAHHPYSLDTVPDARDLSRDRVQIGELDRLTSLLSQLYAAGRFESPQPLYLTEYGYETSPPDPTGHPPEDHARYLGLATFLAWRTSGVQMFPQFLLKDKGPKLSEPAGSPARWPDYQSGLFAHDGAAKPAVVQGFKLPFHAEAIQGEDGTLETVAFGQVRPLSGLLRVTIERLDPGRGWISEPSLAAIWTPGGEGCGDFSTDEDGFYGRRMAYRPGATYRAVWTRPDGVADLSPTVTTGPLRAVPGGAVGALAPPP
jgi:hypothetical protein